MHDRSFYAPPRRTLSENFAESESVPIQLAQCWFPAGRPFPLLKQTEAILSNSAQKLLRFEIIKMLTAV